MHVARGEVRPSCESILALPCAELPCVVTGRSRLTFGQFGRCFKFSADSAPPSFCTRGGLLSLPQNPLVLRDRSPTGALLTAGLGPMAPPG